MSRSVVLGVQLSTKKGGKYGKIGNVHVGVNLGKSGKSSAREGGLYVTVEQSNVGDTISHPQLQNSRLVAIWLLLVLAPCLIAAVICGIQKAVSDAECTYSMDVSNARNGDISIWSIALSPDDRFLLLGTTAGIYLYDLNASQVVWSRGTPCTVTSVALDPKGMFVAGGLDNGPVLLMNANDGKLLHRFTGHRREINQFAWSSDGKLLASAGWDNTSRIWDVQTYRLIHTFVGVQPSDQSSMFTSMTSIAFSPDNSLLATGHSPFGLITIWDVSVGKQARVIDTNSPRVTSLVWSKDNSIVVAATEGIMQESNDISGWHIATGQPTFTLEWPEATPSNLTWSPDYSQLAASVGTQGKIVVWEVESQKVSHVFSLCNCYFHDVLFSHDGKQLIAATSDKVIAWNMESSEEMIILDAAQLPPP